MIPKIAKIRPWMLKKEIIIIYYAWRDGRTGLAARLPVILAFIYLFSPFDFLPDFIPFLGFVDDLLIIPLCMNLAIRMLPPDVREESILKANRNKKKFQWVTVSIILLFLLGVFLLLRYFINRH